MVSLPRSGRARLLKAAARMRPSSNPNAARSAWDSDWEKADMRMNWHSRKGWRLRRSTEGRRTSHDPAMQFKITYQHPQQFRESTGPRASQHPTSRHSRPQRISSGASATHTPANPDWSSLTALYLNLCLELKKHVSDDTIVVTKASGPQRVQKTKA